MKRTMISRRARALTRLLFATGLLTAPAACTAILGGFDFDGPPEGSGGSGGSGGSSSSSSSASSSSSGSTSSSSGSVSACDDGKRNGDESDVDCGGSCPKCGDDQGCNNGGDCVSKVCTGGTCVAATCTDTLENGAETDVDCGGPTCPKCPAEKGCGGDDDCVSGSCVGQVCASSCTDGVQDGDETDEDCGGASCPRCEVDGGCLVGTDCTSGLCESKVCKSNYLWAKQFGDSAEQFGRGVAADALGNAYLASWVASTTNFGGADLVVPSSAVYLAIAKLSPSGQHIWSKGFPAAPASAVGISVDFSGNSVVAGNADTGSNFGGGVLSGTPSDNIFLARFDTGGNHLSSKLFPNANAWGIATGTQRYAVTGLGLQQGSTNFGCGSLAPKGTLDGVLAVFHTVNNTCAWSKRFGMAGSAFSGTAVALDEGNNVLVNWSIRASAASVDVGCGQLAIPPKASNVLAKYDEITGNCLWNVAFGNPNANPSALVNVGSIGVDGSGNITVGGNFSDRLDIGTESFVGATFTEVFLAQFDQGGTFRWARRFANPLGSGQPPAVAVSSAGNLAIAGTTVMGTDFGAGPVPFDGPFAAEFDSAGKHLWSLAFPTQDIAWLPLNMVNGVAYGGAHELLLTGNFPGSVDFGGGPLTTLGGNDIFVARLAVP